MMKLYFILFLGLIPLHAFAGLRFNHLVYVCKNYKGVEFHILKPHESDLNLSDLKGHMLAYNRSSHIAPELGMWCSSKVRTIDHKIKISEKEIIAEDPSSCEFLLDTNTLKARTTYKRWNGYLGVVKKPEVKISEILDCEIRNELVDY